MINTKMLPASVYEPFEDDTGDLGTKIKYRSLKNIECAIAFGSGNVYLKDGVLTTDSTHKALTVTKGLKSDMRIKQGDTWYRISAANDDNPRMSILYLEYTPVSPL